MKLTLTIAAALLAIVIPAAAAANTPATPPGMVCKTVKGPWKVDPKTGEIRRKTVTVCEAKETK